MYALRFLFLAVFLAASVFHLACCALGAKRLQGASKGFLMPLLAIAYLAFSWGESSPPVLGAILCGFLGDVLLLAPERRGRFLAGLGAFLLGHLFYAGALAERGGLPPLLPGVLLATALLLAGILAYVSLQKALGEMRVPVIAYLAVILGMAFFALSLLLAGRTAGSLLAAVGSVCFILSDYLLARSLFLREAEPSRDFFVMLFYLAAQCCLAVGLAIC